MLDSTILVLQEFLKFQIRMNTPFPLYNVDRSPETNAFNAGIHYGFSQALGVLNSFKTTEELSDYLASLKDGITD